MRNGIFFFGLACLLLCGCAAPPRGKSLITSSDTSPLRLIYFGNAELSAAANEEDKSNRTESDGIPEGGRLKYTGIHILFEQFGKSTDQPYLRVMRNGKKQRLKCKGFSTIVSPGPGMKQIKSSIACDILDTLPTRFTVEVCRQDGKVLETFEVYPDSSLPAYRKADL